MVTVFDARGFRFAPPAQLAWARRVLIKPCACSRHPYPATTSPELLESIVSGIRTVTDAEIIIADSLPTGESIYPNYEALKYHFNRVLMLDAKDSIFLEMENPLQEFFATPTFWVPNLVLRSDFLISVAPYHVQNGAGKFSIANYLGLLPLAAHHPDEPAYLQGLRNQDVERVLADLYFALPFDMGIVEARQRLDYADDPGRGEATEFGKIIVGEPFEVDMLAAKLVGMLPEHLNLINRSRKLLSSEE